MPHEPLSNIGPVCDQHAPKPGKFIGQAPASFFGKFVKLGFPAKDPKSGRAVAEHMWVRVEGYGDKQDLRGKLDNDPILECEYQCGDLVAFDVAEIEAVA